MNELISVIVPVYKVEPYLRRCIDSIIDQTYKNLEIILVDDGSPDNCGKICDEYAEKDGRVKVVHKKNGGLSSARNAGLDVARGSYIGFVDSDDYIASEMYQKLYDTMVETSADICSCMFEQVDEAGKSTDNFTEQQPLCDEVLTPSEALEKLNVYLVVVWSKLYRSEIFDGLRFPEGKIHEDEFFIHHAYIRCKKIATVKDSMYYYLYRQEGIIGKEKAGGVHPDAIDAYFDRMNCLIENGYYDAIENTEELCWVYAYWSASEETRENKRQEYLGQIKKIKKYVSLKNRIKWVYLYFPFVLKIKRAVLSVLKGK